MIPERHARDRASTLEHAPNAPWHTWSALPVQELLLLDLGRRSRSRCRLLLHRRGGRSGIGDAANALAESLQALTQSLAQLRQPLGAEQKKCNYGQDHQMPRLKKITHRNILRMPHLASTLLLLSHRTTFPGQAWTVRNAGQARGQSKPGLS